MPSNQMPTPEEEDWHRERRVDELMLDALMTRDWIVSRFCEHEFMAKGEICFDVQDVPKLCQEGTAELQIPTCTNSPTLRKQVQDHLDILEKSGVLRRTTGGWYMRADHFVEGDGQTVIPKRGDP